MFAIFASVITEIYVMVKNRQSGLQGTPQRFYMVHVLNLSEETFYHGNYIYIKYGQL